MHRLLSRNSSLLATPRDSDAGCVLEITQPWVGVGSEISFVAKDLGPNVPIGGV